MDIVGIIIVLVLLFGGGALITMRNDQKNKMADLVIKKNMNAVLHNKTVDAVMANLLGSLQPLDAAPMFGNSLFIVSRNDFALELCEGSTINRKYTIGIQMQQDNDDVTLNMSFLQWTFEVGGAVVYLSRMEGFRDTFVSAVRHIDPNANIRFT